MQKVSLLVFVLIASCVSGFSQTSTFESSKTHEFKTPPKILADSVLTFYGMCGDFHKWVKIYATCDTTVSNNISICFEDSILLQGAYQHTSGIYRDTLLRTNGCDSILETNLTVRFPGLIQFDLEICDDDSVFAAGAYRDSSGIYIDSLTNINGCDSLIITTLVIRNTYNFPKFQMICQGDSFFVGGAFQNTSGVYYDTINSAFGCDSVILTQLQVDTITASNDTLYLCSGDSLLISGQYINIPGTYVDTISSIGGCDSVLNIIVMDALLYSVFDTINICLGDSFFVQGAFQLNTGSYFDTLISLQACDSIINLYLNVDSIPTPNISFNDPIIFTGSFLSYQWYLNNQILTGVQSSNHTVVVNGNYHVEVTDSNGCLGQSDTISIVNLSAQEYLVPEGQWIQVFSRNETVLLTNNHPLQNGMTVYSMTGALVLTTNKKFIELSKLSYKQGVYFVIGHLSNGESLRKRIAIVR